MNNILTTQEHWEDSYKGVEFRKIPKKSFFYTWILDNLPKAKTNQSSLEIGIFPGGFSTIFGDLGYEINGIDRIEEVNQSMKKWMESESYKVGDLICDDFFTHKFSKKYDVVSSFGFIEHFKNFEEIIKLQADLVKKEGYIIIEVPNLRGIVQNTLFRLVNKKIMDVHYIPSMNFKKWENVLINNNFQIINKDYLGNFSFDVYPQKRNFIQKAIINFLKKRKYFLKDKIFKGVSKYHSPYMILIAKKI